MTRTASGLTMLAVAVCTSLALSAQQPDFSGTWIQNMEKSGVPEGASLIGYSNTVEQRDGGLTVVSIVRRRGGETTDRRAYVLGKDDRRPGPEGSTLTTTVTWEGAALIFETSAEFGFVSAGMRETWTLSADGKTLTKVRITRSPLGDNRQTFVLEKR